jgi:hypothetical protein
LHITGTLQGYINDPLVFSGFNTIVSPFNNTQVTFDVAALVNKPQSNAVVGGATINFVNFQSDGFGLPPVVAAAPSATAAIIPSTVNLFNNGGSVDVNTVITGANNSASYQMTPETYTNTSFNLCTASGGSSTICGTSTMEINGVSSDDSVSITNFVIDNLSNIMEDNRHAKNNKIFMNKKMMELGLNK